MALQMNSAKLVGDVRGSQIVELAVALPLLVVFVVGIFDFGSAFGIKQKIANAAREGARTASNQPTRDLSYTPGGGCGAPTSVCAIRDAVDHYLAAANVNDCGLGTALARRQLGWHGHSLPREVARDRLRLPLIGVPRLPSASAVPTRQIRR